MRFHRSFVFAVVLVSAPLMAWGQGAALDAIRKSGNASEAVAAYARALGAHSDPTMAQQAFITRMIELKSPALAEDQAKEVTQWTNDGQAWAVLAFVDAQNDRIEPALDKAYNALKYAPGNEFAATTAGQIVAWYDLRNDQEELGESVKSKAQKVRGLADRSRAFSRAHDSATRILTEGIPDESGGGAMPVNIVGSLEELGTYSGYTTSNVPGLVSYWNMPAMYPGFDLEPWWADFNMSTSWAFPPVRLRNVSRNVRYLRMPGNQGFMLVDGFGATVVPTGPNFWRTPYYAWQRDPWFFNGPGFVHSGPGFINFPVGPVFANGSIWGPAWGPGWSTGWGSNWGSSWGPGWGGGWGPGWGGGWGVQRGYQFNAMGTSRLAQRIGGGIAFPGTLVGPPPLGSRRSDGIGGMGPGRGGIGGGGRGGGRGPR